MCVGLSAKVVKISEGTAVVDAGGAKREVSAQLLEDLEPGDYVMVHAGVAIAKITDEDDDETDQLMEELLLLQQLLHMEILKTVLLLRIQFHLLLRQHSNMLRLVI